MEYRRSVSDNLFDGCHVVKVVLATKKNVLLWPLILSIAGLQIIGTYGKT